MRIGLKSNDVGVPFENLIPLVSALTDSGNVLLDGGFRLSQAGWICRLANPIDFDLIQSQFEFPENIALSKETDTILDRNSWCAVEGPGADVARQKELRTEAN